MTNTAHLFVTQIFQDVDGAFSSKRVVAFGSFVMLVGLAIASLAGVVVPMFMFTGFMTLTLGCLGITATEPFGRKAAAPEVTQNNSVTDSTVEIDAGTPDAEGK